MNLSLPLQPSIIVIFGITGDLSQRYLLPALYHLMEEDLLHELTEVVGISRRDVSKEDILDQIGQRVSGEGQTGSAKILQKLGDHFRMLQLDLDDQAAYQHLHEQLDAIEEKTEVCMNRLYYLSVPPSNYGSIITRMGQAGLNKSCQHDRADTRLLIEKPFGDDLESGRTLIKEISGIFSETQLFRIDHYLAKETVQNILTFRFQNPIFENVWNRDNIASIEIMAGEQISIEGRANFYDKLGALRDIVQSHLLQLLAIVTMDQPESLDSDHIHEVKQRLLTQVTAMSQDQVSRLTVRGQYEGYREEAGNPDSATETFAGIKIFINSPRWRDVPLILWTGKALDRKRTEICINFRNDSQGNTNLLRFFIQPEEGIELDLLTKKPGLETELQPIAMGFSYAQKFGEHDHPNAYERVLVDAVRGDHTLFATDQEVLDSWRIVQPVLDAWQEGSGGLIAYKKGADGRSLIQPLLS